MINKQLVGQRFREARLQKHFTCREVSEVLGISTSYYSRIERNGSNLRLERLVQICILLDLSVDDLMRDCSLPQA